MKRAVGAAIVGVTAVSVMMIEPIARPEPAVAGLVCKKGKRYVLRWGCVSRVEIAKAIRTCSRLKPPAKFTGCLCQDGDSIGACGD